MATDGGTKVATGGVAEAREEAEQKGIGTHRALRNAGVLTMSLIGTWSVALAVRLLLPRLLGPSAFGALHFADYFAQGFLLLTALGVDTYIRKEVATRHSHASDFFGGVLALRILVGLVLAGTMLLVLYATGRGPEVRMLVILYAMAHFFLTLNQSYAALLQARGTVGGLAVVNFLAKAGWGICVLVGLFMGAPLWVVPAALIGAEICKTAALTVLCRRNLTLKFHFDTRATCAVMVASLPFFLNILAQTLYDKIDISMIGIMAGNAEAGFYGAATILTAAALMLTPIISSVLLPHSSHAAAQSKEALQKVMEGALRTTFAIILPVAFLLIAGAPLWVQVLFGEEFAPTVPALRLRATSLVLTYVATLSAIHLIQLEKMWTVTTISLVALAFNPTLNYFLIQAGVSHLGAGGAGSGAATASLASEMVVVTLMQLAAGRRAILRTSGGRVLKCAAALLAMIAVFAVLEPLGHWRLFVSLAVWLPAGVAVGAIDVADISTLREAVFGRLSRRHGGKECEK